MSAPTPGASRGPISCKKYEPIAGTRRCKHYLTNGGCTLPDEFMCVEWLRANAAPPTPLERPAPVARDLFGAPVRPAAGEAKRSLPVAATPLPARTVGSRKPANGLALDEAVASFRERGLEVRIATDQGEVWIVPNYTGAERTEVLVEHAALISTVTTAFPGARMMEIRHRRA